MSLEKQYAAMAQAMGMDPSQGQTMLFHISNKTYADALHQIVMQPLMDSGYDFVWTDWQQGLTGRPGGPRSSDVPGIGTTDIQGEKKKRKRKGKEKKRKEQKRKEKKRKENEK